MSLVPGGRRGGGGLGSTIKPRLRLQQGLPQALETEPLVGSSLGVLTPNKVLVYNEEDLLETGSCESQGPWNCSPSARHKVMRRQNNLKKGGGGGRWVGRSAAGCAGAIGGHPNIHTSK